MFMMAKTVQNYIDDALVDCYSNLNQIPQATCLRYFNDAVHDAEKRIAYACRDYFQYEKIQTDLILGQSDYDLPLGDSDGPTVPLLPEFKNITQVWLKYNDNSKFYRANPLSPTGNIYHTDTLESDQSGADPQFELRGGKIYIFPTPKENVTDGLQIDFRATQPNYIATDTENDIPFPRQEHRVFLHKLRALIFMSRGKVEEKQLAEQDYEREMGSVLARLADIYNAPVRDTLPPLSSLMY